MAVRALGCVSNAVGLVRATVGLVLPSNGGPLPPAWLKQDGAECFVLLALPAAVKPHTPRPNTVRNAREERHGGRTPRKQSRFNGPAHEQTRCIYGEVVDIWYALAKTGPS